MGRRSSVAFLSIAEVPRIGQFGSGLPFKVTLVGGPNVTDPPTGTAVADCDGALTNSTLPMVLKVTFSAHPLQVWTWLSPFSSTWSCPFRFGNVLIGR